MTPGRAAAIACTAVAGVVMLVWGLVIALLSAPVPALAADATARDVVLPASVAVAGWATDQHERAAGVHGVPLRPGQSLVFVWPSAVTPAWTMAGVRYPLNLAALDAAGRVLWRSMMEPCTAAPCVTYRPPADVEARTWVETRPLH